jgi:hypothetical protein
MKSNGVLCLLTGLLALTPAAFGQKWEFGGGAGGGFYTSQTISNSIAGNADAKIGAGPVGSVWLGYNSNSRWGGEVRYEIQSGDAQLSHSGTQASFGGMSHAAHYDLLYHFLTSEDKVRPFVAVGAGVKFYQGTGTEVASQPLSGVALLTKTSELKPVISTGFGIKARIGEHWSLRASVYDFITPFPSKVFTPNAGSKVSGIFNDFVPMIGLSYLF